MSIRPATIEDAPQITVLLHQLGYRHTQEAVKRRLEVLGRQADTIVLVAENDQRQVTGCIHVIIANRLAEGQYGEITSLVIAEKDRGNGVGRQLVASAADWLRGQGLSRMRVRCNTVRKEAHHFYAHLGFREAKSQKLFDCDLSESGKSS